MSTDSAQARRNIVDSVTVDKVAIKAAIEAGIDVPGAKLITDKTTLGRK
jgi:hypothetical protein